MVDQLSFRKPCKSAVFDLNASRYLEEFKEICSLGKGAYGTVFKVSKPVLVLLATTTN